MIAFDVYLNGEKVCTAGNNDLTSLTATVNFFPKRYKHDQLSPTLTVGGVVSKPEEFLDWVHRELRVGDRVEVKVVESSKADRVLRRRRPAHAR
jgi:hypothetical protein